MVAHLVSHRLMRCIQCGSLKDKVLDSRMSKDGTTIRRRRECLVCNYRYTSYEQIERTELRVVKRDGTREVLNREKLFRGLVKACEKRPVPMDRLDRAVEEILTDLRIAHVRRSLGMSLSGGERRRVEIARALAANPRFLLLDEPFAGVDPISVIDIQRIVRELSARNIGVLITDHNVQETLSITDRAYLLYDGQILKAGTAEELAADEQVRKVYLGQNFELRKNKQQVI